MSRDDQRDRALGMDRPITRRDFVNGVALAIGATALPIREWWPLQDGTYAPERDPSYYPPGLTGLRGDHEGSFEAAHQMRDGGAGSLTAGARATGEKYDLIVVGGGISGLAAAYFYQQNGGSVGANPGARQP